VTAPRQPTLAEMLAWCEDVRSREHEDANVMSECDAVVVAQWRLRAACADATVALLRREMEREAGRCRHCGQIHEDRPDSHCEACHKPLYAADGDYISAEDVDLCGACASDLSEDATAPGEHKHDDCVRGGWPKPPGTGKAAQADGGA
jgi:hypothetical protein